VTAFVDSLFASDGGAALLEFVVVATMIVSAAASIAIVGAAGAVR